LTQICTKRSPKPNLSEAKQSEVCADAPTLPPHERFDTWTDSPEGDVYLQSIVPDYPGIDLPEQLQYMFNWIKREPKKGNKTNWKGFVGNWMDRELRKLREKVHA
jgi:hypothetical protein